MALTSCTINSGTLTKTGGQPIDSDSNVDVTLVITPTAYHSVRASNFTRPNTMPSGVSAITFGDVGVPGSFANKVNVFVELDNSFTMPSADTTLTIDIDGAADKGETVSSSVSGKNIHINDSEVTITTSPSGSASLYSASGIPSSSATTLFTKVFAAGSARKFSTNPATCFTVDSTTADRYVITVTENTGTFSGGNLTNYTLTIAYKFPNEDSINNKITYVVRTEANVTTSTNKIYSYNLNTGNLSYFGETRTLNIAGDVGAQLKIDAYVTSVSGTSLLGSSYNNVGKTVTIPSGGIYTETLTFPANATAADIGYSVKLTEVTGYDFVFNSGNSPKIEALTQFPESSITIGVTRTSTTGMTIPTNTYSDTGFPLQDPDEYTENYIGLPVSWVINSSGASWKSVTQPVNTNLSGSSAISGSEVVTIANSGELNGEVTAVINNTTSPKKVTISGAYAINRFPSIPTTTNLVLDNIITLNAIPVATAQSSVAIANNTPTLIQLAGTDADSDSLTYSIVSQGSKGAATVVPATGVATYTPTNTNSNGHDNFTFKVNDGLDNSSPSTIAVVIASAGGGGNPAFTSVWSWNNSENNSNYTIITTNAFKGTPAYTNSVAAGSSSFKANVTSWSLDATHAGYPTYCDNLGDIGVTWALKYSGTTLTGGVAGINSGTSSVNQSARTGTINLMEITVTVPNTHNSGNGLIAGGAYTFDYKLRYEDISQ